MHFCLSGALARAVRWRWITVNPLDQAERPRGSTSDPDPPTSEQAAAILNAAFPGLMWGYLWLAMTTGARRGELCALRWNRTRSQPSRPDDPVEYRPEDSRTREKDTKAHQQHRIALDADTVSLLRVYRAQCEQNAVAVGVTIAPDGRLFSATMDHSKWLRPSPVSNRYARMCARLGWDMNLYQLRHRTDRGRGRPPHRG